MKILLEEYAYPAASVGKVLEGLSAMENVERMVCVEYVGYFYNPAVQDCVFILPKVLLDGKKKVFGHISPESLIHVDLCTELTLSERKFLYEFAVWIYRAICVYREDFKSRNGRESDAIYHRLLMAERSGTRRVEGTFLDILLAIVRFNWENQPYFTSVLREKHSGYNKINWTRTISHTRAFVQEDEAVFLRPVNKKRQVNFEEELLVIFFSILNRIHEEFGFSVHIEFGFELIKGSRFDRFVKGGGHGYGCRRLREIKYKYFSDKALRVWSLCFDYFEKADIVDIRANDREYLLVKNFNIVFEAMIDELVGDRREELPEKLKDQPDGKRVDHLFRYRGLAETDESERDIYYIGDSKYYGIGSTVGSESVYKQYTYARNVIQYNLDILLSDPSGTKTDVQHVIARNYRDELTEGYNIVPNFFISAKASAELNYADDIDDADRRAQVYTSEQFRNRLFDRDTQLICHYDVNFLFIIALYARRNVREKAEWKQKARKLFREKIRQQLAKRYDFYVMAPKPGTVTKAFLNNHFRLVSGKVFDVTAQGQRLSLALNKSDNDPKVKNAVLLNTLRKHFYVVPSSLGEDVEAKIVSAAAGATSQTVPTRRTGVLAVMMEGFQEKSKKFLPTGRLAVALKHTEDSDGIKEHIENIGYVLFHTRGNTGMHLFAVEHSERVQKQLVGDVYQTVQANNPSVEEYLLVSIRNDFELVSTNLNAPKQKSPETRYDAEYAELDSLKAGG